MDDELGDGLFFIGYCVLKKVVKIVIFFEVLRLELYFRI